MWKAPRIRTYGRKQGGGRGRWSPPKGCKICSLFAKEVLVGSGGLGVSRNFPGKSSPSSPSQPFTTLFSPLDPCLQFFHPSNTSLQLFRAGLYQPFLPLYPFFPPPTLPFSLGPYRTPSEHLRNPSLGSPPKGPKRPFLGIFRGFPPNPPKGAKNPLFRPFLTPFLPLPYPL